MPASSPRKKPQAPHSTRGIIAGSHSSPITGADNAMSLPRKLPKLQHTPRNDHLLAVGSSPQSPIEIEDDALDLNSKSSAVPVSKGRQEKTSDTPTELIEIAQRNARESPLLRLPPELRNRIAQYVCGNEDRCISLVLRPCGKNLYNVVALAQKVLQQTCRQLRAETFCLAFLINDVRVDGVAFGVEKDFYSDTCFEHFRSHLYIDNVRAISLVPPKRLLHNILTFAKQKPRAQVCVTIYDWNFTHGAELGGLRAFMIVGWAIEKAIQGRKQMFPEHKKLTKSWSNGKALQDLDLPNLRFHTGVSEFDEETFREALRVYTQDFVKRSVFRIHGNDEERVVEHVRGWFANGI